MTTIQKLDGEEKPDSDQDLILTLNLNEEIIQFNKESERFTGYLRDEILHKNFNEIFVPGDSIEQWKGLLDSIRQALWVDNFILPLKTRNNESHLISWTGFLVKDENGAKKNICIFGKPLIKGITASQPSKPPAAPSVPPAESEKKRDVEVLMSRSISKEQPKQTIPDVTPTSSTKRNEPQPKTQPRTDVPENISKEPSVHLEKEASVAVSSVQPPAPERRQTPTPEAPLLVSEKKNKETIMKHRVKKIMFASKKTTEQEQSNKYLQEQFLAPLTSMGKVLETTSHKLDIMNESLLELSQKYEQVTDRVTELEKKDKRWQKKQKTLQEPETSSEKPTLPSGTQQINTSPKTMVTEDVPSEDEEFSFFSDPFGVKRQRRELQSTQQQLETRSKQLDALEAQLQKERTIFNARVEEFSKWREKLMLLESEIEKRRQELMKQEASTLVQKIMPPSSQKNLLSDQETLEIREPFDTRFTDETLDTIPQSAAIIQRGILKQVNIQFIDLLGYHRDELLEKSFFDFIALDGLADVEKYYLDRLKGDAISMYMTVFLTKENVKIPVEVNIKQTVYNGEKAEIVVVTVRNT